MVAKAMIDRNDKLPVARQCQILELSRSTAYYQPQPESPAELALMRRIDELHLEMPYAGARMLSRLLKRDGKPVGRKRVSTLMQRMGIHALYRKPNTSKRHPAHKVYPYLLRNLEIVQSNHVWAADITYIPMKRGFVYLFAVMDWASRRVLTIMRNLAAGPCSGRRREARPARRRTLPTLGERMTQLASPAPRGPL